MGNENPATLLYERLTTWAETPAGKTPKQFRTVNGDWVEQHLEAIRWLLQVRSRIQSFVDNGAKGVDDPMFIEELWNAVFTAQGLESRPALNGKYQPQDHITDASLRKLALIGADWKRDFDVAPALLVGVADIADEAIKLVTQNTSLGDNARHYLFDVAEHLKKAVAEVGIFGTADVRRLANELNGALLFYMRDAPEQERSKAFKIMNRLVQLLKYGVAAATGGIIEAGASFGFQQLTS